MASVVLLLFLSAPLSAASPQPWTTAGPSNSAVSRIVVDPRSAGTLYAIADGRLCESTDGGRSWSVRTSSLFSTVLAVAVDPLRSGRIFVGTNTGASAGGLFVSDDGGASWESRGLTVVRQVWIDPSRPNTLYADDNTGFFRTLDGGLNWTRLDLPQSTVDPRFAFAFGVGSDGTAFVWFSSAGVFRSSDRGETWVSASPSPPPFSSIRGIVTDPTAPAVLYALGPEGLFRSADSGSSWQPRGGGSAVSLAIDPHDAAVLYAGSVGGVWKSTDAGQAWQPVGVHPPFSATASVVALAVDPKIATTIYSGTINSSGDFDQGFYLSEDGAATWDRSNRGLPGVGIGVLAADPSSPAVVYAVGAGSVYKSRDSGASWEETSPRDLPYATALAVDPVTPTTLYVGTSVCPSRSTWQCEGEVRKTADAGASWSSILKYGAITALVVDPHDPSTLFLSSTCINLDLAECQPAIKSADGGATWQAFEAAPPGIIGQFLFDPRVSRTVFALALHLCATCSPPRVETTVFKTTDGGATWNAASSGLPVSGVGLSSSISRLAIDPRSNETVYAATRAGLFRSTDGAASWGLTGLTRWVQDLAFDPWDPNVLYAATEGDGVLRSVDGGANWLPINDGLANLDVLAIVIDSAGAYLHAATASGAYELPLPRAIRRVGARAQEPRLLPRR